MKTKFKIIKGASNYTGHLAGLNFVNSVAELNYHFENDEVWLTIQRRIKGALAAGFTIERIDDEDKEEKEKQRILEQARTEHLAKHHGRERRKDIGKHDPVSQTNRSRGRSRGRPKKSRSDT